MKSCIDSVTLSRFQDGELPAVEVAALESHLAGCPACRRRSRLFADLHTTLATAAGSWGAAGGACPDEQLLAGYSENHLSFEVRDRVERHLADCGHCTAALAALGRDLRDIDGSTPIDVPDWALAHVRSLVGARETVEAGAQDSSAGERLLERKLQAGPQARRRPGEPTGLAGLISRWLEPVFATRGVGLAAVASLALLLAIWMPQGGVLDDAAQRGGTELPVVELLEPGSGQLVTGAHLVLSWKPVKESSSYTVTVVNASGEFFWQRTTAETTLRLPVGDSWQTGQRYFWWVTVLLDSGRRLESMRQNFSLRE